MSIISNIKRGVSNARQSRQVTCGVCGHTEEPKIAAKGSTGAEVMLWIILFPVGLIYSLWRMASKRNVCAACGSETIVPANSGAGEHYRNLFHTN